MEIDIRRPKKTPGEILDKGGSWSDYNSRYDAEVSKAYLDAELRKAREAEEARRALIDENHRRRRAEELSWNPIQPGITTTCLSCGAEVHIYGTYRDGYDDTDPREPHLFRESVENHAILTARCGCGKSLALDMGRIAPAAPRNFMSLSTLTKTFGIASEAPASSEEVRKPRLHERFPRA
jgi:hypothetical protein